MQKSSSPLQRFKGYWQLALRKKDPTADCLYLATVDSKARPHVRTVLIKTINKNGVGFVTNRLGPKVLQMKRHHYVECCAAWPKLKLQVRIGGQPKPMSKKILQVLWSRRPREAQILYSLGIPQSSPILSFNYLLKRVKKTARQWSSKKTIPLSQNYIGFIIQPQTIEFLHHNPTRLNKREYYQKISKGWVRKILAP